MTYLPAAVFCAAADAVDINQLGGRAARTVVGVGGRVAISS
jgi:hypothetical protein